MNGVLIILFLLLLVTKIYGAKFYLYSRLLSTKIQVFYIIIYKNNNNNKKKLNIQLKPIYNTSFRCWWSLRVTCNCSYRPIDVGKFPSKCILERIIPEGARVCVIKFYARWKWWRYKLITINALPGWNLIRLSMAMISCWIFIFET